MTSNSQHPAAAVPSAISERAGRLVIFPAVDSTRLAAVRAVAGPLEVVNADTEDQAARAMALATAFFGKVTPRLLAEGRQLRWVQAPIASMERFLFPELVEHPCAVTNMRGIYCDPIADQVLGYMIAFARQFLTYFRHRQERRWSPVGGEQTRQDFAFGPGVVSDIDRAHATLAGATLGIVGLGSIGREIVRRAVAHRTRVVAIDPLVAAAPEGVEWVRPPRELSQLLEAADYVVVCAPHTPETAGWFGAEQFRAMRPGAYFINVGRGAIVSLDALVEALRSGSIAGAALDVYETEPLPVEHPLWNFDNVILTPHVAGFGLGIAARHLEVLLENLQRFVAGEPLIHVVDKRAWY